MLEIEETQKKSLLIEWGALFLLSALAFAVRCWGIGSAPFWINEADNSRLLLYDTWRELFAWTPSSAGLYLGDILLTNMILFFVPEQYIHGGESGLRLPSAFVCSLSVPMVYMLSSRFCDPIMSWLLTISWAINPFVIDWSQQVYTYGMWPLWATMIILATFRLTDSIKSGKTSRLDWAIFHFSMILAITSNLFIILLVCALFPHVFSTILFQFKNKISQTKFLLSAYAPHFIPGIIATYISLSDVLDPTKNDNSWMPSATWSSPYELLEILFPHPSQFGAKVALLIILFGSLNHLRSANFSSFGEIIRRPIVALIFAGSLQLLCFLILQFLGSPSWSTRYMLHLIPIWLVLFGFTIAPKQDLEITISPFSDLSFRSFGLLFTFFLVSSTAVSLGPATEMRYQDTRGAWEAVAEDYDDSENQVFITHPNDYFFVFYIELFELSPDLLVGSWHDFSEAELDSILSGNPDSVHRVRLETHDDAELFHYLSIDYELVHTSNPKGMTVEHWVRR